MSRSLTFFCILICVKSLQDVLPYCRLLSRSSRISLVCLCCMCSRSGLEYVHSKVFLLAVINLSVLPR
ncbi:unnamed protein product [Ixodes pacificus]